MSRSRIKALPEQERRRPMRSWHFASAWPGPKASPGLAQPDADSLGVNDDEAVLGGKEHCLPRAPPGPKASDRRLKTGDGHSFRVGERRRPPEPTVRLLPRPVTAVPRKLPSSKFSRADHALPPRCLAMSALSGRQVAVPTLSSRSWPSASAQVSSRSTLRRVAHAVAAEARTPRCRRLRRRTQSDIGARRSRQAGSLPVRP